MLHTFLQVRGKGGRGHWLAGLTLFLSFSDTPYALTGSIFSEDQWVISLIKVNCLLTTNSCYLFLSMNENFKYQLTLTIRCKPAIRWQYLSRMKNRPFWEKFIALWNPFRKQETLSNLLVNTPASISTEVLKFINFCYFLLSALPGSQDCWVP